MVITALALSACGDGGNNDGDGQGGADGFGGSGGSDVPGGAGTGGQGEVTVPPCLEELMAKCPLSERCVAEADADAPAPRCYDNGTKAITLPGTECNNSEVRVYEADGSLCYSRKRTASQSQACESVSTTWYDAAGTPVAYERGGVVASAYERTLSCAATDWSARCSQGMGSSTFDSCTGPLWDRDRPVVTCDAGECSL